MNRLSFRHFLELVQEKPSYISGLSQLGIDSADVAANPQYLGNATMGKFTYSGVSYQIVKLLKNMQGEVTKAVIKPMQAQPAGVFISAKDGKKVLSPSNDVGGETIVDVATLNKMLNQEVQPGMQQQMAAPEQIPGGPQ